MHEMRRTRYAVLWIEQRCCRKAEIEGAFIKYTYEPEDCRA